VKLDGGYNSVNYYTSANMLKIKR